MNLQVTLSAVERLAEHHHVLDFRCGKNSLDLFIRRHALLNQRSDSSQTYVVHTDKVVVGYYTLVFSSVRLEQAPERIRKTMPQNYPVPVMLFARFAVDRKLQRCGIGSALLKDAFLRTAGASEIGGLAAILVDAIDDKMVAFYKNLGFQKCFGEERKLMISMSQVRDHLTGAVMPG